MATAKNCPDWAAKLLAAQGKVEYKPFEQSTWMEIKLGATICPGDAVRVGAASRATLQLRNETLFSMDQKSSVTIPEPIRKKPPLWVVNLLKGVGFFRSRDEQSISVNTPFINAVHKGTEFMVAVDDQQTRIDVIDGSVTGIAANEQINIAQGQTGIAEEGKPLRVQAITLRPEDTAQWALYYPPIIDNTHLTPSLQSAVTAYQQGNPNAALETLGEVTVSEQNAATAIFKAQLLLSVGRLDEAEPLIKQLLALPKPPAPAIALQAVIAVTKNQQTQALALAQQAIKLEPQSASAQIALSYAQQAVFKLDKALVAAQQATHLAPDSALAWARLAELQSSQGNAAEAMQAAQTAQKLNPRLGKTQVVLGFAQLAQTDRQAAQQAFEQAIVLDSVDPMARLGLGLAKIRGGDLQAGKQDLEAAVSLDPNNASLRSYLGKTFYELRNSDYAGKEFEIAKAMDNKDPTPWFYDAILKQTTNRPVEALQSMQQAISLNDNRRVYRSRVLLDQDAAARTANLARIYNDLGFGRVALKEAWTSLGQDASNPSAHRFLSDSYTGQPRYNVARASELLQAQLLQPINITPVQPQLTSENIGILNSTGPGSLSVNEYDPLYNANGAHLVLNGAYGSNNTKTDNAIISGVYNKLSMSAGQFHYQTDGFRQNDDFQRNIYNVFAQYAFTPDFNLQFELKSENVRAGDVPLRLNGYVQNNLRQTTNQDTARVGGHYKINAEQDFIASYLYTTRKGNLNNPIQYVDPLDHFHDYDLEHTENSNIEAHQTEFQYLYHPGFFEVTAGFGYLNLQDKESQTIIFNYIDPPGVDDFSDHQKTQIDHYNGYVYTKQHWLPSLTTTLGLSFDALKNRVIPDGSSAFTPPLFQREQFNPKFGFVWNPLENITLRGAVFRTLNHQLTTNQTIEPTQVAGFNQFYDNINGTTAWRYAGGLDYRLSQSLFFGGEVSWRDAQKPFNGNKLQQQDEVAHLAYLYWTPKDWLSFKTEYQYEKIARGYTLGNGNDVLPQSVETHQVPTSLSFFHPNGLFSKVAGTYVNQHVAVVSDSRRPVDALSYQSEDFWTFDTVLGYRFPKKIGTINFEVRNLFDNHFKYQSNFDFTGPQLSPYVPERQFFIKLSLFY